MGIGIYIQSNDQNHSIQLYNKTNIKTIETIAIKTITLALIIKDNNIIIITDSESACKSIKTAKEENTERHLENQIIDKAGHNRNKNIIIHWIPGHCGISGNTKADQLARNAINTPTHRIDNEPTISDMIQLINKEIQNEWTQKYREMINTTGKFYKTVNPLAREKVWFHKKSIFSDTQIKMLTSRLRTGHAFNKVYKNMIKLEEYPNCMTCRTKENNEHIINICPRYNDKRRKYPILTQKPLKEILNNENEHEYLELIRYINDIEYRL